VKKINQHRYIHQRSIKRVINIESELFPDHESSQVPNLKIIKLSTFYSLRNGN